MVKVFRAAHSRTRDITSESSKKKYELRRVKELADAFIGFKELISEIDGEKRMLKYRQVGEEYRAMVEGRHQNKVTSRKKLEYQIVGRHYRQLLDEAGIDAVLPARPLTFIRYNILREFDALLDV
jgi:hypothetical protein